MGVRKLKLFQEYQIKSFKHKVIAKKLRYLEIIAEQLQNNIGLEILLSEVETGVALAKKELQQDKTKYADEICDYLYAAIFSVPYRKKLYFNYSRHGPGYRDYLDQV